MARLFQRDTFRREIRVVTMALPLGELHTQSMSQKDGHLERAMQTRLKNLTAKKVEQGELEPRDQKVMTRITEALASRAAERAVA